VLSSFLAPFMLDLLTDSFKHTEYDLNTHTFLNIQLSYRNLLLTYCTILILNNLLGVFFDTQYNYRINILKYETKTALQYLVYNKLTKLTKTKSSKTENGEEFEDVNINNLALIDSENIVGVFAGFHQTWSSAFSLCFIVAILYIKVSFIQ
jgi:hypothetical protein